MRETPPSDRPGRQRVAFTMKSEAKKDGEEKKAMAEQQSRVVLKSVCGKGQNTLNTQGTRT